MKIIIKKIKKIASKRKMKLINIKGLKPRNKKKIYIKFGIDPTYEKLHLGHIYILNSIKKMQKIKKIYAKIIIGGYTAKIGDPSGRKKERKIISKKKLKRNNKEIRKQIEKILIRKKTIIYDNFNWLRYLNIKEISNISINKIIKRREIIKRKINKEKFSLGELIYPIFQSIDDTIIKADIEIGGEDQIFNLLVNNRNKLIIISKIIKGINTKKKMSSSNNIDRSIFMGESTYDIFNKILKISDEFISEYEDILVIREKYKKKYGNISNNKNTNRKIIIFMMISKELRIYKKSKKLLEEYKRNKGKIYKRIYIKTNSKSLIKLLKHEKIFNSIKEFKRNIKIGIIKINKEKLKHHKIELEYNKKYKLEIGRKQYKIKIQCLKEKTANLS